MRRAAKWLGALLALPFLLLALYALAGWIGSSIPRNPDWREAERGVAIMVATNGVHTEFVMPVVTGIKDWRETFPSAARPMADGFPPTHLAIGWGEREVLLETATWSDLSPATALRIATVGGDGLLRVGHFANPGPNANYRPLTVREDEYARLVAEIEAMLPPLPPGEARRELRGFQPGDVHYDARGHYTMIHNCNQWTSDVLAAAGVRTGWWTPFAGGVMKWVGEPVD